MEFAPTFWKALAAKSSGHSGGQGNRPGTICTSPISGAVLMVHDDSGETIDFLRPERMAGTELMIAHGSRRLWHVYHETYAFCACHEAGAFYHYRSRTHRLSDRNTMLIEPGEVHRNTIVHKPANFKVLFIAPRTFEDMAHELGIPGTPHFRSALTRDPRVYTALYQLSDAIEANDTLLRRQSLLAGLTLSLFDFAERQPELELGANRPEPRAIARAKAYLRERYAEEVSLDELAGIAGLSRFRLARTFAREVGLPPHAYQIHVRVARARTLLRSGMPQAGIAAQLGFSDQSHFIRHFRHILRVTPGEYARNAV
jgi:AraC-like DNA-binding protein